MEGPPKNTLTFFDFVDLEADEERVRLQDFLREAQITAVRTEILVEAGEVDDCPCLAVRRILERQTESLLLAEWLRCRDWKDSVLKILAQVRGWDTLRGRGGRREALEEFLPVDFDQMLPREATRGGRPRSIYLGQNAHEEAVSFLDHARDRAPGHVEDTLNPVTVVTAAGEKVSAVPLFEVPGVPEAVEVVQTARTLEEGPYSRQRNQLAHAFLASLLGCRQRAVRYATRRSQRPQLELWQQARALTSALREAGLADLQDRDPDRYEEIRSGPSFGDVALTSGMDQLRELAEAGGVTVGEVKQRLPDRHSAKRKAAIRKVIDRLADRGRLDGTVSDP